MDKPNYLIHDKLFLEFKENGAGGWGGEHFESRLEAWQKVLEWIQLEVPLQPGMTALEVGCGTADLSFLMEEQGLKVCGLDISENGIAWAKEKAEDRQSKIELHISNLLDLNKNFGKRKFDFILDGNCIHCIIGDDRKLVLQQIFNQLDDEGYFYLSHMIGKPICDLSYADYDEEDNLQLLDGKPYRYMPSEEELEKELELAGFELHQKYISKNEHWQLYHGLYSKKIKVD